MIVCVHVCAPLFLSLPLSFVLFLSFLDATTHEPGNQDLEGSCVLCCCVPLTVLASRVFVTEMLLGVSHVGGVESRVIVWVGHSFRLIVTAVSGVFVGYGYGTLGAEPAPTCPGALPPSVVLLWVMVMA